MRKIFKKVLPVILICLLVVTMTSCKKVGKRGPRPTIGSDLEKQIYITLGNYKVTNREVFYRLLNSYGLSTLYNTIDAQLLKDVQYDEEGFNEQLNLVIYGVEDPSELDDEEKTKLYEEFIDSMELQGYFEEKDWKEFYILEYKRIQYAIARFKEYVTQYDKEALEAEEEKDPYFTEEDYEKYYESNYHKDLQLYLVTFDSEAQARSIMRKYNIDTSNEALLGNWKKVTTGEEFTKAEIEEIFKNMYAEVNGEPISEPTTYKYSDLTKISSTIRTKAYSLDTEKLSTSYTHGPQTYVSRYFLLYKVGETEGEDYKPYEEVKDEIYEGLIKDAVTNAIVTKYMFEARNKIGLKIYDLGLETLYKNAHDAAYAAAGETEYDAFITTKDGHQTNFVSYTIDGTNYTITAVEMFDMLEKRYGLIYSLLLIQQYVVLANPLYNDVYDYVNGTILDKEKYDEMYETDITELKNTFNKGGFASNGFPKSYKWENFLLDYMGIVDEKQILINLDSSLYDYAEANFMKAMYMGDEEKNDEGEIIKTKDQAIQDEMEKIFNAYFSASVIGLYAYLDKDLDSKPDEVEADSVEAQLLKDLVDLAYEKAIQIKADSFTSLPTEKALSECFAEVVRQYVIANKTDSTWGRFKAAGVRLTQMASTTYNNASNADDILLENVKSIWDEIVAYADNDNGVTITDRSLDVRYRYTKSDVAYSVTAEQFANGNLSFISNNSGYRIAVINTTGRTYISTSAKTYKPTLEQYENYLLPDDDDHKVSQSTNLKNAITNYYIKAINNLTAAGLVTNKIMDGCEALLPSVVWAKDNTRMHELAQKVIEANRVEIEE